MTINYHLEVGVPLLIISLLYAFYALRYRAEEYELVKKILYIEIPLFVALTAIVFEGAFVGLLPTIASTNTLEQLTFYITKILLYALQYSVTAAALWMLLHMVRKDFRYYLARAFIKNTPDNTDNIERLQWH